MGRNIPPKSDITTTIHPLLSLAIYVTWVAALVATVSSLCGIWTKKSSKSTTNFEAKNRSSNVSSKTAPNPSPLRDNNADSADTNATTTTTTKTTTNDDEVTTTKPLPPPPAAAKLEFGESKIVNKKIDKSLSLKNYTSKASTRRKLSTSISMRMSMKIKDKASEFKDRASEYKRAKQNSESLWTKRIILGEKCKLPYDNSVVIISSEGNDNDNDDDNDGYYSSDNNSVVIKSKGRAGHRAMSSRSFSSIDYDDEFSTSSREDKLMLDHKGKGKKNVYSDEEDEY